MNTGCVIKACYYRPTATTTAFSRQLIYIFAKILQEYLLGLSVHIAKYYSILLTCVEMRSSIKIFFLQAASHAFYNFSKKKDYLWHAQLWVNAFLTKGSSRVRLSSQSTSSNILIGLWHNQPTTSRGPTLSKVYKRLGLSIELYVCVCVF